MLKRFRDMGPGALVAAAFIGPGTITACTLAGANFGYVLLWALLFATVATIILQEMSARLGLVMQQGLGETLKELLQHSMWKWPLFLLIIVALYVGNAAYEGGNLAGAALGLDVLSRDQESIYPFAVVFISLLAAFILWRGSYRLIEQVLRILVLTMVVAFVATFIAVKPDLSLMVNGLFMPRVPEGSLLTVIALIGTTVVPYNLFLHASAVKARWTSVTNLNSARSDSATAIGIGGLLTILIASTAAASIFGSGLNISGAGDMAVQMEPLFGSFSKYMLGLGFFAAGLSSAMTAPLATAYAMTEILGIKGGTASLAFRLIALSVIVIGAALALTGIKPITIIIAAQFANGLLLPIIASFLLFVMNQQALLGKYTNGLLGNVLGGIVVLVTTGLGLKIILQAAGWL
ncbi:MAG: manganese transport protein [Paraglaciecola sp.]|jgi:manganese transport protein